MFFTAFRIVLGTIHRSCLMTVMKEGNVHLNELDCVDLSFSTLNIQSVSNIVHLTEQTLPIIGFHYQRLLQQDPTKNFLTRLLVMVKKLMLFYREQHTFHMATPNRFRPTSYKSYVNKVTVSISKFINSHLQSTNFCQFWNNK